MQKAFCKEGGTDSMKKFTKIILLIAAVLTVVGLGFIIAGSVTAGGAGALTAQLRSGELNFGNWHFEDGVYYKGDMEVNVTDMVEDAMKLLPTGSERAENEFAEEIIRLEIDVDLANIMIKAGDIEKLRVCLEEGYTKYYDVKVDGDTLKVAYDVGGHTFKQGPKIVVEVPKYMVLEQIYIDTDLGEITLLELEEGIEELEIISKLGNIRMDDCKVKESCTISAALGNIVIEDSSFGMVDMSADMGNINFSGKVKGDMTVQDDMGNIEVELEGNKENYNIQLSTDVGNVMFDGKKQENSFDAYHGNAQSYVILNCDMGDVELSFD